jgi:hypothetical protein
MSDPAVILIALAAAIIALCSIVVGAFHLQQHDGQSRIEKNRLWQVSVPGKTRRATHS